MDLTDVKNDMYVLRRDEIQSLLIRTTRMRISSLSCHHNIHPENSFYYLSFQKIYQEWLSRAG